MEAGYPSTRAVNPGRQLGKWKPGLSVSLNVKCSIYQAETNERTKH